MIVSLTCSKNVYGDGLTSVTRTWNIFTPSKTSKRRQKQWDGCTTYTAGRLSNGWRRRVNGAACPLSFEKGELGKMSYKGWKIRTGFLGGDLFGDMLHEDRPVDERESIRTYARMLQDALEQEF